MRAFFCEVDELANRLGKPPEVSQLLSLTLDFGWVWMDEADVACGSVQDLAPRY
jgi:hypothetical protein